MSTETKSITRTVPTLIPSEPVPLESGDHLTRAEFHRRYLQRDDIKTANLVEGVVYVASPVRYEQHGKPHAVLITWLGVYVSGTSGIDLGDNATVLLDNENEVQPDALLRIVAEQGGQSFINDDDYVIGPPELIIEVAASSAAYHLHAKRRVYARTGVQEYLVIQIYEQQIDWFGLREGSYESIQPDQDGVFASTVFPGLWLDSKAFWKHNLADLLATLRRGMASRESGVTSDE